MWGSGGVEDPTVLEWAAEEGRILLTHDSTTIPPHAYQRASADLAMPGVFVLSNRLPTGQAIDAILLAANASEPADWVDRVEFLPL